VLGPDAAGSGLPFATVLRLQLVAEHLDLDVDEARRLGLEDGHATFEALRESATRLEQWYRGGRTGPRPPGRLRVYRQPALSASTKAWAWPLYRVLYDPDGRTPADRLAGRF